MTLRESFDGWLAPNERPDLKQSGPFMLLMLWGMVALGYVLSQLILTTWSLYTLPPVLVLLLTAIAQWKLCSRCSKWWNINWQILDVLATLALLWMILFACFGIPPSTLRVIVRMLVVMYLIGMFIVTAILHRGFSHKAFAAKRPVWATFGFSCTFVMQRGPLWWALHHRDHHKKSDQPDDVHSVYRAWEKAKQAGFSHEAAFILGFLWGHIFWIYAPKNHVVHLDAPDVLPEREINGVKIPRGVFAVPELLMYEKYYPTLFIGPAVLLTVLFFIGQGLGIGGTTTLVIVWPAWLCALWNGTFFINSLSHLIGLQSHNTGDKSGNSFLLALITLGEGWHNHHHKEAGWLHQGFSRIMRVCDVSYHGLRLLSLCRIIHETKIRQSYK